MTEQDLDRRLKGLSSSCHGGVTAGVGMEELRAAHASTQDALAAQTLEFHVFNREPKEKVRRLVREGAEGRGQGAQAKKDRQKLRFTKKLNKLKRRPGGVIRALRNKRSSMLNLSFILMLQPSGKKLPVRSQPSQIR